MEQGNFIPINSIEKVKKELIKFYILENDYTKIMDQEE